MAKEVRWRDIDINLQAHPIHGDLIAKKDKDAIQQQIKMICMIEPGELPYSPGMGVGIRALLFENYSNHIRRTLNTMIVDNLKQFVTRARIRQVTHDFNQIDNHLHIYVEWSPINSEEVYEYNFILRKVR